MTRVKRGVTTRARHKKIIKQAKGYRWKRGNVFKLAKTAVMKAGMHAYEGRKQKKRDYRALWITRISAAVRMQQMRYSEFIAGLTQQKIVINRKMLAELAVNNPSTFDQIVVLAKKG